MSNLKVQGNATGTGTFTIAAPSGNTDRTLTLPDEAGTVLTNVSDIETQVKTATNATGSAPVYSCRAWVNFNGTGTVAIRDSGNVSSITDNGTGDYNVNFTTAMPDVNYSISGLSSLTVTANQTGMYPFLGTTTSFRIVIYSTTGTLYDEAYIAAQVCR
jgi:hypothetical protein